MASFPANPSKQREYLANAQAAEDHARATTDLLLKEGWQRIADAYRDLARRHGANLDASQSEI